MYNLEKAKEFWPECDNVKRFKLEGWAVRLKKRLLAVFVLSLPGLAQNVVTNPSASQNIVQPVNTSFSANNLAFWRIATPSWTWSYTDSGGSLGNLTVPGSVTLTLPCTSIAPCPLGIDTASAAN